MFIVWTAVHRNKRAVIPAHEIADLPALAPCLSLPCGFISDTCIFLQAKIKLEPCVFTVSLSK